MDENEVPQELPGKAAQPLATDSEVEAFKAMNTGYDPIGDGSKCPRDGGSLDTKMEKTGGGARPVQRCRTCGKNPAELD